MTFISTIAFFTMMALAVWGLIDIMNKITFWVKQVYRALMDEDDLCQYPEISTDHWL